MTEVVAVLSTVTVAYRGEGGALRMDTYSDVASVWWGDKVIVLRGPDAIVTFSASDVVRVVERKQS